MMVDGNVDRAGHVLMRIRSFWFYLYSLFWTAIRLWFVTAFVHAIAFRGCSSTATTIRQIRTNFKHAANLLSVYIQFIVCVFLFHSIFFFCYSFGNFWMNAKQLESDIVRIGIPDWFVNGNRAQNDCWAIANATLQLALAIDGALHNVCRRAIDVRDAPLKWMKFHNVR